MSPEAKRDMTEDGSTLNSLFRKVGGFLCRPLRTAGEALRPVSRNVAILGTVMVVSAGVLVATKHVNEFDPLNDCSRETVEHPLGVPIDQVNTQLTELYPGSGLLHKDIRSIVEEYNSILDDEPPKNGTLYIKLRLPKECAGVPYIPTTLPK